jgi:hypothetical protein
VLEREYVSISRTGGAAAHTARLPDAPNVGWHLLSIKEAAVACQLSEKAIRRAIEAASCPPSSSAPGCA